MRLSQPPQQTQNNRHAPSSMARLVGFLLVVSATMLPAYQAVPAQVEEQNFAIAVQEYTHNNFTDARTIFEGIRHTHVQEAKEYLDKIKRYKEAMDLANSQMRRSTHRVASPTTCAPMVRGSSTHGGRHSGVGSRCTQRYPRACCPRAPR